jgi:hypothetical protein
MVRKPIPCGHLKREDGCLHCHNFATNKSFRMLFKQGDAEAAFRSKACVRLGEDTGKKTACKSCSGMTQLTIFKCEIHGECTVGRKVGGMACCAGCKDKLLQTDDSLKAIKQ